MPAKVDAHREAQPLARAAGAWIDVGYGAADEARQINLRAIGRCQYHRG